VFGARDTWSTVGRFPTRYLSCAKGMYEQEGKREGEESGSLEEDEEGRLLVEHGVFARLQKSELNAN